MKRCSKCKQEKEDSEFYGCSKSKDGSRSWCKECRRKDNHNNFENNWARDIFRKYGITIAHYELMLEAQNGVCAICSKPETMKDCKGRIRRLSVDHDHVTFKIRGLVCHSCNLGLAFLDKENWLQKALKYLEKSK